MAPIATAQTVSDADIADLKEAVRAATLQHKGDFPLPPDGTLRRYKKAGIDLSEGYPYVPKAALGGGVSRDQAARVDEGAGETSYVDPASRADPKKNALLSAATKVDHLTQHIGTEISGIKLDSLTDQQKDELALLAAERGVVFFRDQDLSPQAQRELGLYWGQGRIEVHPQAPQVPGQPGALIIWEEGRPKNWGPSARSHRLPYGGGHYGWHSDLSHEEFPPGYTHLYQDSVPVTGGDTLWASGYAAYDKLSPTFKRLIEGLNGIYRSANVYPDTSKPNAAPKPILRKHPLVRTHPVTGWKSLFVNRWWTVGIEGLDGPEATIILDYLNDVFERSTDIQVRWRWTPGTSAVWDNRVVNHTVSFDWVGDRHGTRVSSLGEAPFYDPKSKGRAESLGLEEWNGADYDNFRFSNLGLQ
ncbi:hypothetical protein Q8F55_005823 [Vanrija albida]|uniref:TauD/TfdA-like domain-containing protein n=1 Tax=Vanrija albida TaxID=181172 RepID=A0ABR3Q2M7_9TREE